MKIIFYTFTLYLDAVYVNWSIDNPKFSERKKRDIIDSMRRAAMSISIWKPYKIILIYKGSIVIVTLLPMEKFVNKSEFEDTIKYFLDQFTKIVAFGPEESFHVTVNIVICATQLSGIYLSL